jgi:hypothetical protein
MNCERIQMLLLQGKPLPPAAQQHAASCAACRTLAQPIALPEASLDSKRIGQIQKQLTQSLTPVRPLPSDTVLIAILLAAFFSFSFLIAVPVGYLGFHSLSTYQKLVYYLPISLLAVQLAIASVRQMIPGSKPQSKWAIPATALSTVLLVPVIFPDFSLQHFVAEGIPCLCFGSICALVSGSLLWFFFRRGFFTRPVLAAFVIGTFAGLAGFAVLALHCPILNAAHILVWHGGAMLLSGIGGAFTGLWMTRRSAAR